MYVFDEVFLCIQFCKFQFENTADENGKKINKNQKCSSRDGSDGNQPARD